MKLSIIIVSYNTKELLEKCLEAVRASSLDKKAYEIIVVDNGSTDGSAKLATIKNADNKGFAAANNQGINIAKGEYILLLNSDAEVKHETLKELVAFMDAHPKSGIAGAKLLNPNGSIQPSGGYLPRLSKIAAWMLLLDDVPLLKNVICAYHVNRRDFYIKTHEVGWVQGAAMTLRGKMVAEIGALDKDIFMYGEDVELCMRAKQHKWQVWHVAEASVIHRSFQSSGGVSTNALLGEYAGLQYIFRKHKTGWQLLLLRLLLKTGALIRMLLFGTILGDTRKYATYKEAFNLV